MSIEKHLQELTEAIVGLTNAIRQTPVDAPAAKTAAPKADVANANTAKAATTGKPADAKANPAVSYDDVKAAVIQLASKKGRDAAVGVLSTFGVDNAQKLAPDQYPTALDALQKAAA